MTDEIQQAFPFSEGVALLGSRESVHADGAITQSKSTPFCFTNERHEFWTRAQEKSLLPPPFPTAAAAAAAAAAAPVIVSTSSSSTQDEVCLLIIAALKRDGAVVLRDSEGGLDSKLEALDLAIAKSKLNEKQQQHLAMLPASHCVIAHPVICQVVDGIIGRQVLRVDQSKEGSGDFESIVCPPGIFTDGQPILSIPWELQEADCSTCENNETFWRARDRGVPPSFPLSRALDEVIEVFFSSPLQPQRICVSLGTHNHNHRHHAETQMGSCTWEGAAAGEALILLGTTVHKKVSGSGSDCVSGSKCGNNDSRSSGINSSGSIHVSYHAAYLRQRQDIFLLCPPSDAISLPPHIQRLIGYSMPGPILNKLYCGTGLADILPAYLRYGDRSVDWAGHAAQQPRADEMARLCGWGCGKGAASNSGSGAGSDHVLMLEPNSNGSSSSSSSSSSSRSSKKGVSNGPRFGDMHLGNAGKWVSALPDTGLVTVSSSHEYAPELLLAALLRDGCCVVQDAATIEQCDAVMAQLEPYSRDVGGKAVGCIPARSSAAWPLLAHPLVLQLVEAVLGKQRLCLTPTQLASAVRTATSQREHAPEAERAKEGEGNAATAITAVAVATATAVKAATATPAEAEAEAEADLNRFPWQLHLCLTIPKQAGSGLQLLHRDGDLSLLDIARLSGGLDHAVSVIWALDDDFTEVRGTTRVVLGSHNWPQARELRPESSVPAVMRRGSVLFYTGRTVHGAGQNTTDKHRVALNVAFNSAFLKQEENQYVSVPREIAEGLPEELQRLLGYTEY